MVMSSSCLSMRSSVVSTAAEALIESLETTERWSADSCDQLREHLYGCDAPAEQPER